MKNFNYKFYSAFIAVGMLLCGCSTQKPCSQCECDTGTCDPCDEEEEVNMNKRIIIPNNYSPKAAGDFILEDAVLISSDEMLGVHDAQFVIKNDKAYVVYEANDVRAGESLDWDIEYSALAVINLKTFELESIDKFAVSEQVFANMTLPSGACFVPRVLDLGTDKIRLFFASEKRSVRQSLTFFIDYDVVKKEYDSDVHILQVKSGDDYVDFTPQEYINQTLEAGHTCYNEAGGAYLFDIFDVGNEKYIALNNFLNGQNALAKFNSTYDKMEIIGHIGYGENAIKTTEDAIIKLEDGRWMAMLRNERSENYNYAFSYSDDGESWSHPRQESFVTNGTNSKPTLKNFGGIYIMGYSESTRSCYRIKASTDAKHWVDLYSIYSPTSFQYADIQRNGNDLFITATEGDKEQIVLAQLPCAFEMADGVEILSLQPFEDDDELAFDDSYSFVSDSIRTNDDGIYWTAYVKRNEKGVYMHAFSDKVGRNDKLFFLLDLDNSENNFSTAHNLMFRFNNGLIDIQTYYQASKRGYRNLALFDVLFTRHTDNGGVEVSLFIPYEALEALAPIYDFTDFDADLYINFYGADGVSNKEYEMKYQGKTLNHADVSTYITIDKEGVLS